MTLADEKVVRVMRRGDFHAAGPEFLVDILVRDDGDFPPDERQNQRFADEFGITLVLRADGNGGISQQRLGTGGGDDNIAVRTLDRSNLSCASESEAPFFRTAAKRTALSAGRESSGRTGCAAQPGSTVLNNL